MASLQENLEAWVGAGIIEPGTAERIRAFEAQRTAARQIEEKEQADRPGVLEALTYLGIVVVAIGAIVLIGQNWDDLETWARISAAGVPALAFLVLGFALVSMGEPGLQRGGQLALLAALGLVAATMAITFEEAGYFDQNDERGALLLVSLAALAVAATLWALVPAHPQVAGVAASSFFVSQAIAAWPDDFSTELAGISSLLIAAVALGLTETKRFEPQASVRPLFALVAVAGAFEARFESPFIFELQIFLVGGLLIALSIARNSFIYMVFGVAAVFAGLIAFIFDHFSEDLGAPLALIITGALTLAGVVILAQSRKLYHQRRVAR